MPTSLEAAFAEVAKLSPEDQDAFAAWILAELASGQRWDRLFRSDEDGLAALADEALDEFRAGKTLPLDADML
jgi:hypothetical protein